MASIVPASNRRPARIAAATLELVRIARVTSCRRAARSAVFVLAAAPAPSARLAVVTTGKAERRRSSTSGASRSSRGRTSGLRSRGVALSLDGMRAYVVSSDRVTGALSAIDLAARQIVGRVPLPGGARQVALSADGARAYVTSGGSRGKLGGRRPHDERWSPRRSRSPGSPDAIALSADGTRAYVAVGRASSRSSTCVGFRRR